MDHSTETKVWPTELTIVHTVCHLQFAFVFLFKQQRRWRYGYMHLAAENNIKGGYIYYVCWVKHLREMYHELACWTSADILISTALQTKVLSAPHRMTNEKYPWWYELSELQRLFYYRVATATPHEHECGRHIRVIRESGGREEWSSSIVLNVKMNVTSCANLSKAFRSF